MTGVMCVMFLKPGHSKLSQGWHSSAFAVEGSNCVSSGSPRIHHRRKT
jgi:hypothetical protein